MKQADTLEDYSGAKRGNISCIPEIAKEVFGEKWEYGNAFAYLWRRFGPSHFGCDDHKDLVAYYLTTGTPGVVLWVSPKPSGPSVSFGYMLSKDVYEKVDHEFWTRRQERNGPVDEKHEPIRGPVIEYLTGAMLSLLVPVFIRDVGVNLLGRVADKDLPEKIADYSEYAGYGITPDYFEKFKED